MDAEEPNGNFRVTALFLAVASAVLVIDQQQTPASHEEVIDPLVLVFLHAERGRVWRERHARLDSVPGQRLDDLALLVGRAFSETQIDQLLVVQQARWVDALSTIINDDSVTARRIH